MQTRTVNISLPTPLLRQVDLAAKREYATRSDFIRSALIQKITTTNRWRDIMTYGKKMGKRAGIKSEADVYRIVEEYRQEKHADSSSN